MRRLPPRRFWRALHSPPHQFWDALRRVKLWFQRKPNSPDDPYSYVTAPKKPRLPHLSAAAVAELPEK
jgi:hypothetical protein